MNYLAEDGRLVCPYDAPTKPLRQAMGDWDDKRNAWYASPLYRDRGQVLRVAELLGLAVPDSWRDYEDPPEVKAAVARALAVPTIRDYQVEGVRWLAYRGLAHGAPAKFKDSRYGAMLWDDPGLGKTLQVLLSLHDDEALVVVCPANAKAVWPREARKWRPDRFDTITLCSGEESFKWPDNPRELVVINYDVLPYTPAQIRDEREELLDARFGRAPKPNGETKAEREGVVGLLSQVFDLADEYSALVKRPRLTTADRHRAFEIMWDWVKLSNKLHLNAQKVRRNLARKPVAKRSPCPVLLVFDEVHYVENHKAARTVRARHLAGKARRIYGLTGTPVDDEPLKLWGVLQTGKALPFSWTVFREQFSAFDGQWGGIDFHRHPPPQGSTARGSVVVKPYTAELLRRTTLRRTFDDPKIAAQLPPLIFSERTVTLDEKLLAKCDEITIAYADYLLRGEMPPFQAVSGVRKALAAASIPAAMEVVEEHEAMGRPLLVFSAHREPVEVLGRRPGWYAITGSVSDTRRGEIEDEFQGDPDNGVPGKGFGVAGTKAMCEAMTLHRAADVLQVDPFLRRTDNVQAVKRSHRTGQTQPVHLIRLVPDHPLVEHVNDLLAGKARFARDVLGDHPAANVDEAELERARATREQALRSVVARDGETLTPAASEKRARARYKALDLATEAKQYAKPRKGDVQDAFAFVREQSLLDAPEAAVATWLAPGVGAGKKHALAVAASMLRRHRERLADRWPDLIEPLPAKGG